VSPGTLPPSMPKRSYHCAQQKSLRPNPEPAMGQLLIQCSPPNWPRVAQADSLQLNNSEGPIGTRRGLPRRPARDYFAGKRPPFIKTRSQFVLTCGLMPMVRLDSSDRPVQRFKDRRHGWKSSMSGLFEKPLGQQARDDHLRKEDPIQIGASRHCHS
jgi:hypothetical protein